MFSRVHYYKRRFLLYFSKKDKRTKRQKDIFSKNSFLSFVNKKKNCTFDYILVLALQQVLRRFAESSVLDMQ